jgi:hypothetical protein
MNKMISSKALFIIAAIFYVNSATWLIYGKVAMFCLWVIIANIELGIGIHYYRLEKKQADDIPNETNSNVTR